MRPGLAQQEAAFKTLFCPQLFPKESAAKRGGGSPGASNRLDKDPHKKAH